MIWREIPSDPQHHTSRVWLADDPAYAIVRQDGGLYRPHSNGRPLRRVSPCATLAGAQAACEAHRRVNHKLEVSA